MAKLLREDYRRPKDWPSIPQDLFSLYSSSDSTTVVCSTCGHPGNGLRLDPETQEFVHREESDCLWNRFSLR